MTVSVAASYTVDIVGYENRARSCETVTVKVEARRVKSGSDILLDGAARLINTTCRRPYYLDFSFTCRGSTGVIPIFSGKLEAGTHSPITIIFFVLWHPCCGLQILVKTLAEVESSQS